MYLSFLAGLLSAGLSFGSINVDTSINDINHIYAQIAAGTQISNEEVLGKFEYIDNDEKQGKYSSVFVSKRKIPILKYINYSDSKHADFFLWGTKRILTSHKIDPLSIKVYKIKSKKDLYTIFIGKAQSASGSGLQPTYFVINKMTKSNEIIQTYEIESRFGSINSLITIGDKDGLSYYKLINGHKMGEFLLTINSVENDQQIIRGNAVLKYLLNDRFVIVRNSLQIVSR